MSQKITIGYRGICPSERHIVMTLTPEMCKLMMDEACLKTPFFNGDCTVFGENCHNWLAILNYDGVMRLAEIAKKEDE